MKIPSLTQSHVKETNTEIYCCSGSLWKSGGILKIGNENVHRIDTSTSAAVLKFPTSAYAQIKDAITGELVPLSKLEEEQKKAAEKMMNMNRTDATTGTVLHQVPFSLFVLFIVSFLLHRIVLNTRCQMRTD